MKQNVRTGKWVVSAIPFLFVAILSVNFAAADVLFTYGFSPRTIGMGGAFTAIADDYAGSYYNPGALIQAEKSMVGLGYLSTFNAIEVTGFDPDPELDNTKGIIFGANIPIPFGSWLERRLYLGISCFFPDGLLLAIKVPYPEEPQYVLLQNSGRSLTLIPTLGIRIVDGLGIGGGAALFDNTSGEINASVDARGQIVTTVGEELPTSFAPTAGIFFAPGRVFKVLKGFRMGLTYRKEFYTHYKIPVNTYLGGIPLKAGFEAYSLYMPTQYVLGLAYVMDDRFKFSFDLSYNRWSKFPDPNLRIEVEMEIPLIPIKFQNSESIDPNFHDTLTYKTGVEWRVLHTEPVDLYLRMGYFFDPSPAPGQTGVTNYLDTDRHGIGISPGITIVKIGRFDFKAPVSFDFSFQYQHLVERVHHKADYVPLDNPGYPQIGIKGSLYSVGIMVGSAFDFE